ncbi:MAG: hypothetical protein CMO74_14020 [Verrucomicrobiales bacterium]|nr:hypothetical protein [Verrucomicrobiales bacterium]|tara:strand:+ start:50029 stop:51138 length:1110 start_codon:yes stop_codon:yes gene_type:complete
MNNLYVLDLGQNSATLAHRGINKEMTPDELELAKSEVSNLTIEEVLDIPDMLPFGSYLVAEDAHVGAPRSKFSLAQQFEEEKLLRFYALCKERGITLLLFSQKLTPRALYFSHPVFAKRASWANKDRKVEVKDVKSDTIDPMAIHNLLTNKPELLATLKKPVLSFKEDPRKVEGWDFKQETNLILNYERNAKYEGTIMRSRLDEMLDSIVSEIPRKESLEIFCLTDENKYQQDGKYGKKGDWKVKAGAPKYGAMTSILGMLMDGDGDLRTREETGLLPGLAFAEEFLFGMTAFHTRGGLARSNLVHHFMRSFIRSKWKEENPNNLDFTKKSNRGLFTPEEDAHFKKYRRKWRRALIDMFQAMKRILERE